MSNTPSKEMNEMIPRWNVFGWGDRGERQNPHMDWGHTSLKTKTHRSKKQYF